jgi:hypothetical protein
MRKLFYLFAISAIVLGMASCGDNDPFAGKLFHIILSDVTPTSVAVQFVPDDKETPYYFMFELAKDIDAKGSVEDWVNMYSSVSSQYIETGNTWRDIPSYESGVWDPLIPNTEYIIIVFHLDEENKPVMESIVSWRFTAPSIPAGALNGLFSVGEYKQVCFSKGNLYYDSADGKYYFQDKQWECIGKDADYASSSGKADLFGWGTGDDPMKISTEETDYTSFSEWGDQPIVNAGNKAGLWRTLRHEEWEYLFHLRKNATNLIGLGKVHGMSGLIILPDGWKQTNGLPVFKPAQKTGMTWYPSENAYYDHNQANNHFEDNDLTDDEWSALEKCGALFMPASGERYSNIIVSVGTKGYYWCRDEITDNPDLINQARDLYFENYHAGYYGASSYRSGAAVRLVWKGN